MSAHILLVDDDPIFRSVGRLSLLQLGHTVSVAQDAKSAFEAAERGKDIRLLIIDAIVPGMNGPELAQKLQAILPEAKVLFISGYTLGSLRALGAPVNPLNYLQKPFRREQLHVAINAILVET